MKNSIINKFIKSDSKLGFDDLYGVEREALRMNFQNEISSTPHPKSLGSALCHPFITTDFSESQVEYTTQPFNDIDKLVREMEILCHFVRLKLDKEYLWAFSMPPQFKKDVNIPIAFYGNSNIGKRKFLYRKGLVKRYGEKKQTISGVHFNFSFGDSVWKNYFELINKSDNKENRNIAYLKTTRNFLKFTFIFPYLFGETPALDSSILQDENNLVGNAKKYLSVLEKNKNTLYAKNGTSLRQSELGYNYESQWNLKINYNDIKSYLKSMCDALSVKDENFIKWQEGVEQLNYNKLQLENEQYAPIRLKRSNIPYNERALTVLEKNGIEYLEIRCFDIFSNSCCGLDTNSFYFTRLFLYYCLLYENDNLNYIDEEVENLNRENYLNVVWEGRDKNCKIKNDNSFIKLSDFGLDLCNNLSELAEYLDSNSNTKKYSESLELQKNKFLKKEPLPSEIFLDNMSKNKNDFNDYGVELGQKYQEKAKNFVIEKNKILELENLIKESFIKFEKIEKENPKIFDLNLKPNCCI